MSKLDMLKILPWNIIKNVVTHLSATNAARSGILSRGWTYAWDTVIYFIYFDTAHNSSIDDSLRIRHGGGLIRSLIFKVCLRSCSYVDKWILFFSPNGGIQDITLEFKQTVDKPNRVPCCLFSCQELREVVLRQCSIDIPASGFTRFPYLHTLCLYDTTFTEETIQGFVYGCPLLQKLELEYPNHLNSLRICAPRLQHLRIKGSFKDLSLVGSSELLYVSVKLIECVGCVNVCCQSNKKQNKRKKLHTFNLQNILGSLRSLEELEVRGYFLQILATGKFLKRLPGTFNCLTDLRLALNFHNSKEILTALSLFRSSPQLQGIRIKAMTDGRDKGLAKECFWEKDENIDCLFHHLEIIELSLIKGEDAEMKFIKFVLASSPKLVTMRFKIQDEMESIEELRILKELLQFHRASPAATINYLD